jgi:hypothetical protein
VSYAPFPGRVHHVYRNSRTYTTEDVTGLARHPYRFLILPATGNSGELERAAEAFGPWQPLYEDQHFRTYVRQSK